MNEVTMELSRFALNMHSIKQAVASKNLASTETGKKLTVNFSTQLAQLDRLPEKEKLILLKDLNGQGMALANTLVKEQTGNVELDVEHGKSTEAQLEYQALVETLNRKIRLMGVVMGGNR